MPLAAKKKKTKKKKKQKLPAYWTNPEDLYPFWGLKGGDLIKTPLGLIGTVLGVKYKTKQQDLEGGGKIWVEYPGKPANYKSPLDIDSGDLGGYMRCHEGDQIWKQFMVPHEKRVEKIEAEREIITELNRRYRAELQKKVDEEKKKKQRKKKKPAAGTVASAPRPTQPAASAKVQPAARSSVVRPTTSVPPTSGNKTPPAASRTSITKVAPAARR